MKKLLLAGLMAASVLGFIGCKGQLANQIVRDANEVTVDLSTDGNGSVTLITPEPLLVGGEIEIRAIPHIGYEFDSWEVLAGTVEIRDGSSNGVVVPSSDCALRAVFRIQYFRLTLRHDGDFDEVILDGNAGAGEMSGSFPYGTWIDIEAVPLQDYRFINWNVSGTGAEFRDNDSSGNPTHVRLKDGDVVLTAAASLETFELTLVSSAPGAGSVSPPGTSSVESGEWFGVSAAPNGSAGFEFIRWDAGGSGTVEYELGPAFPNQYIRVSGGHPTLTAVFALKTYTLTVAAGENGNVTGGGTVIHGEPSGITATPDHHYSFSEWIITDGSPVIISPASSATDVVLTDGSAAIEAVFSPVSYNLHVRACTYDMREHGIVFEDGVVSLNPPGITAVPFGVEQSIEMTDDQYLFAFWETNSSDVDVSDSHANPSSVSVSGHGSVIAVVETFPVPTDLGASYISVPRPSFRITWTDNTTNETGFRIKVTNLSAGNANFSGDVPADSESGEIWTSFLGSELDYRSGHILRFEVAAYKTPAGASSIGYQWSDAVTAQE